MTTRQTYTIVLRIIPTAPLTHGAGNDGNEQILATREVNVRNVDGEWERIETPHVSGAALKSTLREWAVRDQMERAGIGEGAVSRDALRLLLKGGKNDSGGASVSLDDARRLRDLFPLLAVFGSMDGGLPIRGLIQVSDVLPYSTELVAAGLVPTRIAPMEVVVDGQAVQGAGPAIDVYPDTPAIPSHMVRTTTTNYRHDMGSSGLTHYLTGAERKQIEDAKAERKAAGKVKAEVRREANESMPHSAQAIAPGTPMVATIRLHQATEVEFACLAMAISRWVAAGGHLGGGSTKGHGACVVEVAGALRYSPPTGERAGDPGTAIALEGRGTMAEAYLAHVAARAEQVRAYVAEATR